VGFLIDPLTHLCYSNDIFRLAAPIRWGPESQLLSQVLPYLKTYIDQRTLITATGVTKAL